MAKNFYMFRWNELKFELYLSDYKLLIINKQVFVILLNFDNKFSF